MLGNAGQEIGLPHSRIISSAEDPDCYIELSLRVPTEALALYSQALEIREQVLGPSHPKTRETRTAYNDLYKAGHQ